LAETRRRGRSTRRRGARTPVRFLGWQGARGRRRATPTCCSPPGATLERFLGGGRTTAAEIDGGGGELELGFAGLAARQEGGAIRLDRGSRGRRRALNSPGRAPWRAGHTGTSCSNRTRRRCGGVRRGDDVAEGMTGGTHGSATHGGGGERLAQLGGPAGPEGLLGRVLRRVCASAAGGGCWAAALGWAAAACWAGKGRRAELERERVG
jgi:hypothetical protein